MLEKKKKSKTPLIITEIIALLLLVTIFIFDIQFILETISVGSGFIIFIWLLMFAIELPFICVLIAVAIIFANKIYKYNKEIQQTEQNL